MHAQQSRADKALELAGEIITIRHERHASQGEKNANADFFSRYTFEAINTFNEWERLEHLKGKWATPLTMMVMDVRVGQQAGGSNNAISAGNARAGSNTLCKTTTS